MIHSHNSEKCPDSSSNASPFDTLPFVFPTFFLKYVQTNYTCEINYLNYWKYLQERKKIFARELTLTRLQIFSEIAFLDDGMSFWNRVKYLKQVTGWLFTIEKNRDDPIIRLWENHNHQRIVTVDSPEHSTRIWNQLSITSLLISTTAPDSNFKRSGRQRPWTAAFIFASFIIDN